MNGIETDAGRRQLSHHPPGQGDRLVAQVLAVPLSMSVSSSHYDLDRFGAAFPRFTPRQADLLLVVGTISHKIAPILKLVYDQMCEPKWVIAFGVCTCTGGFYDNYATVQGIDTIIPVDIYIPGCPPRPETVLQGLMLLQEKIARQKQDY